jgi:hypothetical protein
MTRARRPKSNRIKTLTGEDIAEIWLSINETLTFSDSENQRIAGAANYWSATARCVTEQNRPELWRAYQVLSAWCADHRTKAEQFLEPILPELVALGEQAAASNVFNGNILILQNTLSALRPLFIPAPPKEAEWAMVAVMVWQDAQRALQSIGRRGGTSPSSYAVRFASAVLLRMGYPRILGATPDGVRKVVEKFRSGV